MKYLKSLKIINMYRFSIAVVIVTLLLSNVIFASNSTKVDSLINITLKYIQCLQDTNYIGALSLFHYPNYYNSQKLCEEKQLIQNSIEIIMQDFGRIKTIVRDSSRSDYKYINIAPGTKKDWKKFTNTKLIYYNVEFEKAGSGCLLFKFSIVGNTWVLRNISYGILASNEYSDKIIGDIYMKILLLMKRK